MDDEVIHMIDLFENRDDPTNDKHHEQYRKFQQNMKVKLCQSCSYLLVIDAFVSILSFNVVKNYINDIFNNLFDKICFIYGLQEDVIAVVQSFEEVGQPFTEDSGNLVDLGHDTIYSQTQIDGIKSIDKIGCQIVSEFMTKRIITIDGQLPFMATLHRNSISIMSSRQKDQVDPSLKIAKAEKDQSMLILHALKAGRQIDVSLFSLRTTAIHPHLVSRLEKCIMVKSVI